MLVPVLVSCGGADGLARETLIETETQIVGRFALDGDRIFWIGGSGSGTVAVMNKDGSAQMVLAMSAAYGASPVAVDTAHAYFVADGPTTLKRVPKVGGEVSTVAPLPFRCSRL